MPKLAGIVEHAGGYVAADGCRVHQRGRYPIIDADDIDPGDVAALASRLSAPVGVAVSEGGS